MGATGVSGADFGSGLLLEMLRIDGIQCCL